jgi:hypothetical protein
MVVTSTLLAAGLATQIGVGLGASLGASFFSAGLAGGAAGYYGGSQLNKKMFGDSSIAAPIKAVGDYLKGPKTPDAIVPDPLPQKGDEGIRAGETARIARKRSSVQLALTQGQNRNPTMLGGIKEQLG